MRQTIVAAIGGSWIWASTERPEPRGRSSRVAHGGHRFREVRRPRRQQRGESHGVPRRRYTLGLSKILDVTGDPDAKNRVLAITAEF